MDYEFLLDISSEPYLYLYVPTPASINIFDGNVTGRDDSRQVDEAIEVARRFRQPGEVIFAERRPARRKRRIAMDLVNELLCRAGSHRRSVQRADPAVLPSQPRHECACGRFEFNWWRGVWHRKPNSLPPR